MRQGREYVRLLRTILVTGGAFVISYLISLFITPYITDNVGEEAYGFVSLARNTAEYAAIITAALNSFAGRYIALAYHKGDMRRANEYYSSTFIGDCFLTAVILAAASVGILFLEHIFVIPAQLVTDVKWLFAFVFITFFINTLFTVFSTGAYIQNKLDLAGLFKTLANVGQALTLILLYFLFPARVVYIGIGLMVAALVIGLSNLWICRKYTPELKIRRSAFSLRAVRDLVLNGLWTSVNTLGELLHNGLDLMFSNLLLTPLAMTQVAIATTIKTLFTSVNDIISQAFQPMFLKSYSETDKSGFHKELILSMKLSGLVTNIGFAGFTALGMVYLKLWIPGQDTEIIYRLTEIALLGNLSTGMIKPLYYIYVLTLKRKVPCIVNIFGGLANAGGMYLLIRYTNLGVYSIEWTTTVVMAVINLIMNPLYMAHSLHLPWSFLYPTMGRNLLACGVMTALFRGLSMLYMPASWLTLILCACVYAALGTGVYLLIVLTPFEWKKVKEKLNRRNRT